MSVSVTVRGVTFVRPLFDTNQPDPCSRLCAFACQFFPAPPEGLAARSFIAIIRIWEHEGSPSILDPSKL